MLWLLLEGASVILGFVLGTVHLLRWAVSYGLVGRGPTGRSLSGVDLSPREERVEHGVESLE